MNALRHNLQYFRNRIRPETRLMAMVKAYSYGSGGHEVAHLLQHEGVDYLAVAYADEGISLRKDGIHLPIMVMNSDADSYELMLDYDLEPEVFSFDSLLELTTVLKRHPERSCKVHIELNSGMNRLGFNADELGELTKRLKLNPQIQVESIFSHLAMSDEQRGEAFTEKQIEQFEEAYSTLVEKLDNRPLKHILNSSGILSFPHAQGDMVRLGIGLYGIDPSNRFQGGLEHVGTLWSTISQIREVDAGEGIGYGQHSVANHKRKVAVVAIGYADGLSRSLSQGKGYFNIAGAKAPIVGNICMDMTMCDVTSLSCQTGDRVQIFGEDPTIQELANILNTIPYEILTSVSQRVKRVYTEE